MIVIWRTLGQFQNTPRIVAYTLSLNARRNRIRTAFVQEV